MDIIQTLAAELNIKRTQAEAAVQLIDEGKKAGVEYNKEQYQKSAPLIKLQLKALIARDLWNMNEYYQTINAVDESVKKAYLGG